MKYRSMMRSTPARLLGVFALFLMLEVGWLNLGQPTQAAAAGPSIGGISFSRTRTADNQPVQPTNNFRYPVGEVLVTFDVINWTPDTRLSRIVRFDGADTIFGDLPTPAQANGRYVFRIAAQSGSSLPEGNWQVFIYANGTQVGMGGFGVDHNADDPSFNNSGPGPSTHSAGGGGGGGSSDNGNGGGSDNGNGSSDNGNGGDNNGNGGGNGNDDS